MSVGWQEAPAACVISGRLGQRRFETNHNHELRCPPRKRIPDRTRADKLMQALQAEYSTLPAYSSSLPPSTLSPLAFAFLSGAFVLSQYFSTCAANSHSTPRQTYPARLDRLPSKGAPSTELAVGGASAVLAGFGLVFAFCAVGANV